MGLLSCFGGGQAAAKDVVVARAQPYVAPSDDLQAAKTGKAGEFSDLHSGSGKATGTTFLSGNTTSLSACTATDTSSGAQYQLNILSSALAGLSGSWYDRLAAAATRMTNVSGAALCTVAILDGAHERFTMVHVTGKDTDCMIKVPPGSQLPALQAVAPSAHLSAPPAGGGLRYNSVQVLQLLQTPLLYSFSDPHHASRETNQPPHDWQAMYDTHGLSDFCALPLIHNKSVVGAVTLAFTAPTADGRQRRSPAPGGVASLGASPLMSCDEQSLRTLGLLLSVLLLGQDMMLAQQIAEIMSGVFDARNLQQVVTVIAAGSEQVLHLTTRVQVATNLAVMAGAGGPGMTATGPGGANGVPGGGSLVSGTSLSGTGVSQALSQGGNSGGRAIFFEERAGTQGATGGSTAGNGTGSRSMPSINDGHGSGGGGQYGLRSRLIRTNTPMDGQGTGGSTGAQQGMVSPRVRAGSTGPTAPLSAHLGVRTGGAAASASQDSTSPPNGSQGGLLWQQGWVQARSLGLRHTLLANLPSTGTVIHDCASYMQQVGCPKRDLYLLSACKGTPPFSLVIAPAPLKDGDAQQLVLYVAITTKLPMELLNEILSQAQQLAVNVLSPLLLQKMVHGSLSEEWALLLGKCVSARGATAAAVGTVAANSASPDPRASGSAPVGPLANGTAGKDGPSSSAGSGNAGDKSRASPEASDGAIAGNRARHPQLPGSLTAPPGHVPEVLPYQESRTGTTANNTCSVDVGGNSRLLPPTAATSQESQTTVLSTAVGGAFAGDTRTHMALLVSSFKDTINALQALRSDEAEELTVLKLGKVLGRGGSGLVFQGYLHLGLEVAVKLFENPDDTDPDTLSADEVQPTLSTLDSSIGPDGSTPDASASRGSKAGGTGKGGDAGASNTGGGTNASREGASTANARRNSSKNAAQMTKRQRDLLRNALELGVTSSLSHPNIVQGYCHWVNVVLMQDASLNRCWLMGQAEYMALAPPGSPPPPLCSALVMEYCDMGSLIHALKRGTFTSTDTKPNMEFIYMCLLEIALALRHLHTAKLAHCDLKPGNVLLRSSPRDARGFVCKLGDFGYAAILKDGLLPGRPAVLPDEACGTLQYMAPELFVAGRPVDASIDIYAFGMLMWELITGKTPYSDNEYGSRALMKAVYHGKRPVFPDTTLAAYKNLAMCCWSGDPTLRPSATVLVKLLRQQLESLKSLSTSSGSASGTRT
ncbi:hypothetical protein HYH03_004783 [Edaphochlamys debaryana]|uniref:Protein kinase domain-containing protein n=1 Tax=Edaphochlamys debaryana TaxID=47281 RepID=A0A835YGK1_9CHLO|nr:hypothetical protein HYH03_004783 [Edaphochlamys debaryana]|eukprot:KAG2497194.1 hypothetical protein HYH03_004783 [Edaphochlamys debaryana]